MQAKEDGPLRRRERGRELVRGWTVAAAVGALGLTGVLGLAAADTFHGRTVDQTATSSGDSTASQDSSSSQDSQGDLPPQAPSDQAFGGGTQPPAVVSGGS
jgi:hypothetical protein